MMAKGKGLLRMHGISVERALNPLPRAVSLTGIPLPPSSNKLYSTFINKKTGKVNRGKSKGAKTYATQFDRWAIINGNKVESVRRVIRAWNSPLSYSMYCVFARERLVTKEGRLKKLDSQNRVKQLSDLLCKLLRIDDALFVQDIDEKVIGVAKSEQAIIVLKPTYLRSVLDITSMLADEGML